MHPTPILPPEARPTRLGALAFIAGVTLLAAACSESNSTDVRPDAGAPSVALAAMDASEDSVAFSVVAVDGLGIKYVNVDVTGGVTATFADTIRTAMTEFKRDYVVAVPRGVPGGTPIRVVASSVDGANNTSAPDTLDLAVGNVAPPSVRVTSPASGATAVAGKNVLLGLSARSALKVKYVGFRVTGAFTAADSTLQSSPLRDSVSTTDTLAVPAGVTGQATVTAFVVDSLGQHVDGSGIALSVVSPSSVVSTPVVSFGVTKRVEVTDTIQVSATDISGISVLGYDVRDSAGAVIAIDSAVFDGQTTPLFKTFNMRLPVTQFPARVTVRGFARNGSTARTRAFAGANGERVDTVVVVAGVTHVLPGGGRVADVYYHPGKDRLYLSNIARNRLEVFSVASETFDPRGIDVGSRPWGIAPWPRSRGNRAVGSDVGDTLLVANSGGTTVSYVDLNSSGVGREVYRYGLPNIVAYSVTSERSATTSEIIRVRRVYDFSDRPQYLAATCQGDSTAGAACGDVVLVYSTQPTAGQTTPFPNRGTVRWENLARKSSHFFFEQAVGETAGRGDTLEIDRFAAKDSRGALVGRDSVLVPFQNMVTTSTGARSIYSVTVRVEDLAFTDTTYVRNSGNFRRAVIGEGGPVANSRAIMYDATRGLDPLTPENRGALPLDLPINDRGISRSEDVRDFIANTSTNVFGAAINFDGELAAIRGDRSTALIGSTLRLQGLMTTTAANPGFDFHPLNTGVNSTAGSRLAFAASSEPQIEIYDTYCYQRVAVIPVRDPIIGPIKSARRTSTGQIMLVGATERGVVTATLGDNFVSTCQQP